MPILTARLLWYWHSYMQHVELHAAHLPSYALLFLETIGHAIRSWNHAPLRRCSDSGPSHGLAAWIDAS